MLTSIAYCPDNTAPFASQHEAQFGLNPALLTCRRLSVSDHINSNLLADTATATEQLLVSNYARGVP